MKHLKGSRTPLFTVSCTSWLGNALAEMLERPGLRMWFDDRGRPAYMLDEDEYLYYTARAYAPLRHGETVYI